MTELFSPMFAIKVPAGLRPTDWKIGGVEFGLKCWHGAMFADTPEGFYLWPAAVALGAELTAYVQSNQKVLDVGCGCGLLSVIAGRLGATITLADASPAVVALGLENCRNNSVSAEGVVIDWSDDTYLPDRRFDIAVASDIIFQHMDEEQPTRAIEFLASRAADCVLAVTGRSFAEIALSKIGKRLKEHRLIAPAGGISDQFEYHLMRFAGN